ncbi:Tetratricopeptide repeat protein [Flavobacterium columnare]|uniref:Tetratricopeptide repeat protein n=1 Tax=Flavobacterium columnare TaxID=996 RepID=A0A2N9PB32_9FLAO|nr:tetratricopeptide repeat protein [Flavobacterium columnare]SPE77559.1 Tetratricopeptide repeat protein [Flavobacterium columnare]
MLNFIKYISILIFTSNCFAQEMRSGFDYLEKGNFEKAELFFKNILQDYPKNKTAQLCYARAVGLNKKPEEAIVLFAKLQDEYPNDFEIKLNYAESLLWNKKFREAKTYYENLIMLDSKSFPAVLGYANCLSNLLEYENALSYVNQALELSKNNSNALISRKYIRLGYADQLSKKNKVNEALLLLDDNLKDTPDDRETLLNKANLLLIKGDYSNAKKNYLKLNKTQNDSIVSLNGLVLANHLANHEKKALRLALIAKAKSDKLSDKLLINQSTERYIQALIWNKKYKKAQIEINDFKLKTQNNAQSIGLLAMLNVYKNDFPSAIREYKNLLVKDSVSFDGNLGIANAYYANNQMIEAYKAVNKTLTFFEGQKDANNLLCKLNEKWSPSIDEKWSYSFDNNKNSAIFSSTILNYPINLKTSLIAKYNYRKTKNSINDQLAYSNDFILGINQTLLSELTLTILGGITSVNSYSQDYKEFLGQVALKTKPFKLQEVEGGYLREIQNFNAELLNRKIVNNHFYINYNIGTNLNWGGFVQYFKTLQSDDNKRNLLFTSVYYTLLSKPTIKVGANYQFINFSEQKPLFYFSPARFNAYEIFTDIIKDDKVIESKRTFYHVIVAGGTQFIEDNQNQLTYRLQGKIGYKFNPRINLHLYGLKSNIASSTAAGFTYTEIGLGFKWLFAKPLKYERLLK